MDVEELLARAWGAVEKAGIPQPLQEYAFKEALARLSRPLPVTPSTAVPHATGANENSEPAEAPVESDLSDPFVKFAHESGVSAEDLERVFYIQDGLPHLNGPRGRLGKSASEQAKTVAVALTAAYDYMRDETPIAEGIVKAEANRLKIDVGGNWAKIMGGVQGVGWIGAARQKQYKTSAATPDALKKVVASILGTPAPAAE